MNTYTGQVTKKIEDTDTTDKKAVVAVYHTHEAAAEAISSLQKLGFDMKKLSIVGKDYQTEENVVGFYTAGDRMKVWGTTGAFWGGLWALLFGTGLFFIPGIGPLIVAGPLVGWIIGALESAVLVGGLSAVGAGLYSIGIPENSIIEYETQIKAGKFVVIAHGTEGEVKDLRETLAPNSVGNINQHNVTA